MSKAPAPPKKAKSVAPRPKAPPRPSAPTTPQRAVRTFDVQEWTGKGEGEKLVIAGPSGVGKTTLAALMADHIDGRVIFIGLDDGARKIKHPVTGADLLYIPGIETHEDVRDALHQRDLWKPGDACVIDTVTKLEAVNEDWMLRNVKLEKGGVAKSLEDYGYGKGYKHSLDTMRLVLQDLDSLVRRGVHIVLLAQESAVKIANPEGLDYIQNGPKLHHNNQHSTRLEVCEWADHVLRIGYHGLTVVSQNVGDVKQGKGKVAGDTQRAIYTVNELHAFAKSRTLTEPVVSYENPQDDTIWKLIFGDN